MRPPGSQAAENKVIGKDSPPPAFIDADFEDTGSMMRWSASSTHIQAGRLRRTVVGTAGPVDVPSSSNLVFAAARCCHAERLE